IGTADPDPGATRAGAGPPDLGELPGDRIPQVPDLPGFVRRSARTEGCPELAGHDRFEPDTPRSVRTVASIYGFEGSLARSFFSLPTSSISFFRVLSSSSSRFSSDRGLTFPRMS